MEVKKSRLLCLLDYLNKQTDEEHPASMNAIITYLEAEGIQACRKTVTDDIERLIASEIDVICNHGNPNGYFIGERQFEMPELKLLVDAVSASRFIPPAKAKELIRKLTAFASEWQAVELQRSVYTDRRAYPYNNRAYINVDILHTAKNTGKKVTFKYFDWNGKKEKEYKHGQRNYVFSPYGMVWNNDRYYTVGWSDSHGKVITFRVDRIAAPRLTDENAVTEPEGFDMMFYAESVFQMYDGPVCGVTLVCENELRKNVIDRFGEEVETEVLDDEHFKAHVNVPASPTFFSWVFTFRGKMRIAEPDNVAAEFKEMVSKFLK